MKSRSSKVVAPVQRAKGGKARMPDLVSGNPEVIDEAEEDKTGDDDTVAQSEGRHHGKKHGGHVKKKRAKGGKVIGLMTGGKVRPRLDRPGRKAGGGVGANSSPLSTAHNTTSQDAGSSRATVSKPIKGDFSKAIFPARAKRRPSSGSRAVTPQKPL